MKDTLKLGLEYVHKFRLPQSKMVPSLYPESEEFAVMPEVFATGFLVGFLEWACIKAVIPHLDWPAEQTVGTRINVDHIAATPAGIEVTATVRLTEIDGRRLVFDVKAHDAFEPISEGTHERFVINKANFERKIREKISGAGVRANQ